MTEPMDFLIFDVETTGLSPDRRDRVVEIAAVHIRDGQEIGRFESLVDPQRDMPYDAFCVNGISDEMLRGAPLACEVMPRFMDFARGCCLVAHNAKFDVKFLKAELQMLGEDLPCEVPVLDTIKMARALIPGLPSYALAFLADYLRISQRQAHRALSDVLTTGRIFEYLLREARKKNITDMAVLRNLFGIQSPQKQKKREKVFVIGQALEQNMRLKIFYASVQKGISVREVTPQRWMGSGKDIAMVGFCHLRQEEREFRIERIVQVETIH